MKPGKIVCVGRNYAKHAVELGNEVPEFPILFLKPSSAIINSGESIVHPDFSNNMHHEAELVLLIGRTLKNATEQEAAEAIAGYTIGLDMTLRDLQESLRAKGQPWTVAKCFDTSAVIGDFILAKGYRLTLDETISLQVNGETRQQEKLNMMIFKPVELICYISRQMTLNEGDYIMTGTPAGVGKVERGDKITASIENIGELRTEVI